MKLRHLPDLSINKQIGKDIWGFFVPIICVSQKEIRRETYETGMGECGPNLVWITMCMLFSLWKLLWLSQQEFARLLQMQKEGASAFIMFLG